MEFDEWWSDVAELTFTSADALQDAYEAARQAWNAAYKEGQKDTNQQLDDKKS